MDAEVQAAKRWMCPQHACAICQRGSNVRFSSTGGRLILLQQAATVAGLLLGVLMWF